jgi:hypothetical protein
MNVMINSISHDLNTTVQGVQVTMALFTVLAAAASGRPCCFRPQILHLFRRNPHDKR